MTSWVVTIAKEKQKHWDIALRDGVWDMPARHPVEVGAAVYFRLSGETGPLLGWGRATSDARLLTESDTVHWSDGRDPYRWRFTFEPISNVVIRPSRWSEVARRLTTKVGRLQTVQAFDLPADDAALNSFFATPLEDAMAHWIAGEGDSATLSPTDLAQLTEDQRRFVEATKAVREGRERFRRELIRLYGGCAVTGTDTEAVIEGAHVIRYHGPQSNDLRNGLPLRRDIHKLFDDHLLAIDQDGRVRVAPSVTEARYRSLDRQLLRSASEGLQVSEMLLAEHRKDCAWLKA